jgi:hypothetical protein
MRWGSVLFLIVAILVCLQRSYLNLLFLFSHTFNLFLRIFFLHLLWGILIGQFYSVEIKFFFHKLNVIFIDLWSFCDDLTALLDWEHKLSVGLEIVLNTDTKLSMSLYTFDIVNISEWFEGFLIALPNWEILLLVRAVADWFSFLADHVLDFSLLNILSELLNQDKHWINVSWSALKRSQQQRQELINVLWFLLFYACCKCLESCF